MKKMITCFLVAMSAVWAQVEDSHMLLLGGGIFSVVRKQKLPCFQLEYRSDVAIYKNRRIFIRPLLGGIISTQSSRCLYGGVAFECFFSPKIVFTPSFAPGLYWKGQGIDLGHHMQFRSAFDLAYRFHNRTRIGAMFHHFSNASLNKKVNPGTECLLLYVAVPLN